jgi:predicted DNA-binding transcriptional regulator AlpA
VTATQLDQTAVAARLGVTRATIQRYRSADRGKYGFPEPDGMIGRTPWWKPETIDAWAANRPGKGAGGGRPKRTE